GGEDGILALLVTPILSATVVAIIIAAPEARAEVIAILLRVDIIPRIAVGRVLVGVRIAITIPPAILLVGLSDLEAFFVPVIHRLPEQLRPILVRFVVPALTIITAVWHGREVGIVLVIIVTLVLEAEGLLTQAIEILFVQSILCAPVLALE